MALLLPLCVLGVIKIVESIVALRDARYINSLLVRSVSIETDVGAGTGIILAKDLVLTNFHLFHENSVMRVNGQVAVVVKADEINDLLLLHTNTTSVHQVSFSKKIKPDERIVAIGNPLGHVGMIVHGRITAINEDIVYIDAHVFFGSSGGGVYNTSGELVGVVRSIEGYTGEGFPYGVVISAKTVIKFLESKQPETSFAPKN
jgi:S1-C subfamily serine protease